MDDEDPGRRLAIELCKAESSRGVLATISSFPLNANDNVVSPQESRGDCNADQNVVEIDHTYGEPVALIQHKTLAGRWPRDAASSAR